MSDELIIPDFLRRAPDGAAPTAVYRQRARKPEPWARPEATARLAQGLRERR